MIVAAAQVRSVPGNFTANTDTHLAAVGVAARNGADMVVFPELSLTGYEPSLAGELAFDLSDDGLQEFSKESEGLGITIGVGIPTRTNGKPRISQAFFMPGHKEILYSKQHLHDDELPFFTAGDSQASLEIDGETVIPAICYESLVPHHAENAAELGATAYVACVAKHERGVIKAHSYFPEAARGNQFTLIMCNAVGPSDNFVSAGNSAAWNRRGEGIARAGADEECLLLVDLASEQATIERL